MSLRKNISIQLGLLGVCAGAYCGFLIRDEYYFPSHQRIEELIKEFYTHDAALDKEIDGLQLKLKAIEDKEKAEALKAKQNKGTKSDVGQRQKKTA
jgi:hypothetical protein